VSGEAGGGYRYPDSEDECYDGDPSCTWCGGEWYLQECDDPIQCCDPRCDGTWHPCTDARGPGWRGIR
jgi:hypothetical protein